MFEVVVLVDGIGDVEGLLGNERGDVFVALFGRGGEVRLAGLGVGGRHPGRIWTDNC